MLFFYVKLFKIPLIRYQRLGSVSFRFCFTYFYLCKKPLFYTFASDNLKVTRVSAG